MWSANNKIYLQLRKCAKENKKNLETAFIENLNFKQKSSCKTKYEMIKKEAKIWTRERIFEVNWRGKIKKIEKGNGKRRGWQWKEGMGPGISTVESNKFLYVGW